MEELLNIHTDKIAHVVGHGPSLKPHLDDLLKLDKSNNIILSLNDIDICTNLYPDYWITTNPDFSIPNVYERINKFKNTTFIYSDINDRTDKDIVKSLLKVKYYSFDNFHFKSKPNIMYINGEEFGCNRAAKSGINCCDNIIPGRLTIQEYLQKISGYKYHYSTGDSTILPVLAFSIIMGCKKIYLYGVDLDYQGGYVNGSSGQKQSFNYHMNRLKSDFYIINESAKMLDIKITYLGFNSDLKGIFEGSLIPEKVYESDCKNYD